MPLEIGDEVDLPNVSVRAILAIVAQYALLLSYRAKGLFARCPASRKAGKQGADCIERKGMSVIAAWFSLNAVQSFKRTVTWLLSYAFFSTGI